MDTSEQKFQALFNHALDAIVLVDPENGLVTDANPAATRFLKIEKERLDGQHFTSVFPPEQGLNREDLIKELQVRGYVFEEQHFLLGDGRVVLADLSAVLFKLGDEAVIMLTLRDAEERKRAQDERLEAERIKVRLETVTRLNHEINNPLQELLSMVEIEDDQRFRGPIDRIIRVLHALRAHEDQSLSAEPDVQHAEKTRAGAGREAAVRHRILIVDDEDHIRKLFTTILNRRLPDLNVDQAASGQEGIELFKKHHHALIVMDINMPGMDGDQAFHIISGLCDQNDWQMPCFVFCTGYAPTASLGGVLHPGSPHTCLFKPVNSKEFVTAIEERLSSGTPA